MLHKWVALQCAHGGTLLCAIASGVALAAQATKGQQQCWPCFLRRDG